MQHSHSEHSHGESVKKPFRGRNIGIAGLILAGIAGLALTGITTASAASSIILVHPSQENRQVVTRGNSESVIEANNRALFEANAACNAVGFPKGFTSTYLEVTNEPDGSTTTTYYGYCTV